MQAKTLPSCRLIIIQHVRRLGRRRTLSRCTCTHDVALAPHCRRCSTDRLVKLLFLVVLVPRSRIESLFATCFSLWPSTSIQCLSCGFCLCWRFVFVTIRAVLTQDTRPLAFMSFVQFSTLSRRRTKANNGPTTSTCRGDCVKTSDNGKN